MAVGCVPTILLPIRPVRETLVSMATVRLSDLTFGTICRIGITLSTCFWIPCSLLLGLLGMTGGLPLASPQHGTGGTVGFISGALQGIGYSILMDVMLVLGALSLIVSQRIWGGGSFDLPVRKVR